MIRRRILLLKLGDDNFVDLGLSVLWAKGNICKDSSGYYIGEPTDFGCYYSWGNIEGHNYGEGYSFSDSNYSSSSGASLTANIAGSDSAHDAALACLGTGKRMPTKKEFDELIHNCNKTWVQSYNGVSVFGLVFKSNKAGYTDKEIFIPASGLYYYTSLSHPNVRGYYWSSTYVNHNYANDFISKSGNFGTSYDWKYYGCLVRAVSPKVEFVDLGLPSGTKWAKCNLGATSETEYGTYTYFPGISTTEDTVPIAKDMVATTWGAGWHTPTKEQCQELIDYTTYTWETNFNGSGINGGKFTASNGKYIFIPACGYEYYNENDVLINTAIGRRFYIWTADAYNDWLNKQYDTAYWLAGSSSSTYCSTYAGNREYYLPYRGVI